MLLCVGSAGAADAPKPYFSLHDLGHGVWAAIQVPGSHGGGNAGFVVGDDGVLVVDTFYPKEAAEALLLAIRGVTDKPIRYVVDTHYHGDHIGGNGVFARAGATILAQRNVRAWTRTENQRLLPQPVSPADLEEIAALTLPALVYSDGVEVYLGDKKVVVRVMAGHTGGDSVVIVPDAKVVFTGDLYWDHSLPNLVDANTKQQIATIDTMIQDYPDAAFVPGHGKFVDPPELDAWNMAHAPDLKAFRDYLTALRTAVSAATAAGKSGQALEDEVLPKLRRDYRTWFAFDYFSAKNIADTEAELRGTKRFPPPAP
jgi:glyoxylase-like metal-dependent hydrolase (beta-lactamase superfamily II)